ncbi:MAG: hypothetical protein ACR2P4_10390 [Gammaproteobacteria bacterium]
MAGLDRFFTREVIAAECWRALLPVLAKLTGGADDLFFVEPAAGGGAFYDILPPSRRLAMDIAPLRQAFVRGDFLRADSLPPDVWRHPQHLTVVIGNPPFGLRGKTALAFFHRAARMADTIAFIVPVIFRKHFIHKQMPDKWRWVFSAPLPRDAFQTPDGKKFAVNTEFQVWTHLAGDDAMRLNDMRLFSPPPICHDDFAMWQYNNTPGALKVFGEKFDFAVPSQGWQDYTRRETNPQKCEKHKQWMLFAPANKRSRRRLYSEIDYAKLAARNTTSTPGFRKGDIVGEYSRKFG